MDYVEKVYSDLLNDFRLAHVYNDEDKISVIDLVIRYIEKRYPKDVERYREKFSR